MSKSPLFKGISRDSSLPSSLPYPSLHLSHHPSRHPSRQVSFMIRQSYTLLNNVESATGFVWAWSSMPSDTITRSARMWLTTRWCHYELPECHGRDDGRDLGWIKSISPILFPLCIKVFPKIMGEISPKQVNTYQIHPSMQILLSIVSRIGGTFIRIYS